MNFVPLKYSMCRTPGRPQPCNKPPSYNFKSLVVPRRFLFRYPQYHLHKYVTFSQTRRQNSTQLFSIWRKPSPNKFILGSATLCYTTYCSVCISHLFICSFSNFSQICRIPMLTTCIITYLVP